jgi:hypothetical protein
MRPRLKGKQHGALLCTELVAMCNRTSFETMNDIPSLGKRRRFSGHLLHSDFLAWPILDPKDGGEMFRRNVC